MHRGIIVTQVERVLISLLLLMLFKHTRMDGLIEINQNGL